MQRLVIEEIVDVVVGSNGMLIDRISRRLQNGKAFYYGRYYEVQKGRILV